MNTWIVGKDSKKHRFLQKPNSITNSIVKLTMKIIADLNCKHAEKVWEDLAIKKLGDYYDLYVESNTLLLTNTFENFRTKCLEIYKLDPAHFLSAPSLA